MSNAPATSVEVKSNAKMRKPLLTVVIFFILINIACGLEYAASSYKELYNYIAFAGPCSAGVLAGMAIFYRSKNKEIAENIFFSLSFACLAFSFLCYNLGNRPATSLPGLTYLTSVTVLIGCVIAMILLMRNVPDSLPFTLGRGLLAVGILFSGLLFAIQAVLAKLPTPQTLSPAPKSSDICQCPIACVEKEKEQSEVEPSLSTKPSKLGPY